MSMLKLSDGALHWLTQFIEAETESAICPEGEKYTMELVRNEVRI